MYFLKDEVMIVHDKKVIAFGVISDICRSKKELLKYFHIQHPMFARFNLAVQNGDEVYIVDYNHDSGQAGHLKKELRKYCVNNNLSISM